MRLQTPTEVELYRSLLRSFNSHELSHPSTEINTVRNFFFFLFPNRQNYHFPPLCLSRDGVLQYRGVMVTRKFVSRKTYYMQRDF